MHRLRYILLIVLAVATMASCSSSKKRNSNTGRVIVVKDGKAARTAGTKKDNGLHKGWYKNTNNPHHPRTTNPGHTKNKGSKGGTVVVVNNAAPAKGGKAKGHPGKGGNGKGKQSKGGNGKGKKK
jgi:hypothetical protein